MVSGGVMKYLVIGSGGREHAIAWRLLADGSANEVYVAPGNGGIEDKYRINIKPDNFTALEEVCLTKKIDCVVVGPEQPLSAGIVDFLESKKIPAFGPNAAASMIEGSKLFAKKIMEKYNIPTANHYDFTGKESILKYIESVKNYPIVIKLDGLAAGKGVAIPESKAEAVDFINQNVIEDMKIFVEDYIDGEEASILGISDGKDILPFITAQDHKRIFEGDKGPNTGGMGAYAPTKIVTDEMLNQIKKTVLQPTIDGMKNEGIIFKGILYAGLMISKNKICVLEFNARFGDPETQVILPLLDVRLGDLILSSISGGISKQKISFKKAHAISVVMSSGGYPGNYKKNIEIKGLNDVSKDVIVFHAGTERINNKIVTSGGRVLNITAIGNDLDQAKDKVYSQIEKIKFEKAFYRRDIGHRAI
jgi:phosphoribosylamine--glycine ligase